jgi:uncharacterized protein YciI
MISGIFDKLLFGLFLLILFQLPLLADAYFQYLSGYYDAKKLEVNRLESLAAEHHYSDINALIAAHKTSSLPSVRADAENKSALVAEFESLKAAISVFNNDELWRKVFYMLHPDRTATLARVIANFEPGIPLSPRYLLLCALVALALNVLAASPLKLAARIRAKRRNRHKLLAQKSQ